VANKKNNTKKNEKMMKQQAALNYFLRSKAVK
jgi:hypothetical protein